MANGHKQASTHARTRFTDDTARRRRKGTLGCAPERARPKKRDDRPRALRRRTRIRLLACLPLRARFFVENCRNGYRTGWNVHDRCERDPIVCGFFLATVRFFLFFLSSFLFGMVFRTIFFFYRFFRDTVSRGARVGFGRAADKRVERHAGLESSRVY